MATSCTCTPPMTRFSEGRPLYISVQSGIPVSRHPADLVIRPGVVSTKSEFPTMAAPITKEKDYTLHS
jgi:hypothetical protein